jgi:dipeptidyl aminopeptidase/acylaminoacyl peptidase
MPTEAPYGSWKSPITSDLIISGSIGVSLTGLDGDGSGEGSGQNIYWTESRPTEGGRMVIVRRSPDGATEDVIPPPFYARTRVHEYGGGESLVDRGVIYFVNFRDQQLYRVVPGEEPVQVTHSEGMRYADFVIDRARNRLICVREDHSQAGREAVNTIAAIDLTTGNETVLVSGYDFYAAPRLSGDSRLCWLAWNHPNMPWDGCELFVASVDPDGSLGYTRPVAGGTEESIFQPQWSPDNVLYFVSDRSGWWNLYRWSGNAIEPLVTREAEFGRPYWQFGMSTYDFESASRIVCTYCEAGTWHLALIDTRTKELRDVETPFTAFGGIRARNGRAYFTAASPTEPAALYSIDLATGALDVLKRSTNVTLDPGYISPPETIEFPTTSGLRAFGFFYPPANLDFSPPAGVKPPLLVMSHGGPTSATSATFSLRTQYWTSRGIAVLDVNYGGSTGYGRAYRERLKDSWGIVDVDDCVNGALYLAKRGDVDPDKLAITGGSAGGYTTLCILTFRDSFKAGASHFGVADLEALARDTHKFESRYLDGLIGPYPERRDLYVERSPVHHIDRLACPVIFFQGLEDEIVPPNQAEAMVEALRRKGVPVAYLPFEGEQHGFRRAENIKRSLDGELYFYSRIFGFELADRVEPVAIDNL